MGRYRRFALGTDEGVDPYIKAKGGHRAAPE